MIYSLLGWAIVSSFTTAVSLILFKKEKRHRTISMFWVTLANFIAFMVLFYGKKLFGGTSFSTTNSLFAATLTQDLLFYITDGFATAVKLALYAYAFTQFRVSQLIPIVQVGAFFVIAGFACLGSPISMLEIIGIIVISVGAIISGFEQFYFPDILKPLRTIPLRAYAIGFIITFMDSLSQIIMYLATYKDQETTLLQTLLSKTRGLELFHFGFVTSITYYEATLPWLMLFLLIYMIFLKGITFEHIFDTLKTSFHSIIILSIAKFIENYIFLYEFQATSDKTLFIACCQFSIPLTLVLAYLHLNEKISLPEKIGAVLIVIGGLVGAFK